MAQPEQEMTEVNHGACVHQTAYHELALLETMSMDQLREKWHEVCGSDPPPYKKQFLLRRLAYRMQERHYGGISDSTRSRLKLVAQRDALARIDGRFSDRRQERDRILPGTRFVRIWNNRQYEVTAGPDGFEYEGQVYRSLSAVARKITGTRWNGRLFFGLREKSGGGGKRG